MADSSIVLGEKYALTQQTDDVWSARLDLAGNKLTIATPSGFYVRGVEAVSPGSIELHGPRVIQFPGTDSDLPLTQGYAVSGSGRQAVFAAVGHFKRGSWYNRRQP